VVNNAGYGLFGPAEALSDEQVYHQINTNLVAPIQVARAALPYLRAQQGGRIIAISTYGGQAAQPGGSLYHASKWGMEGFFDALHGEAAFFDIGVTIVEPGGARTGFRKAASSQAAELDAYRGTSVGSIRARLEDQSHPPIGDPDKMAAAIIASAGQYPAQKRLVLGSDAYGFIQKALTERLAAVEMQKETAASTDIVPGH
ncbi:MAG: putative short-chain oxidoreductase, partial [Devosia sp.]|nr:putative short-chain oxidoreductase [Devosia sp.]